MPITSTLKRVKLRDYQIEAIKATKSAIDQGYLNLLLVQAMGTGKTVVFSSMPSKIGLRGCTLVIVHTDELCNQTVDKWLSINPDARVAIEKADSYADEFNYDLIVGSIQTLKGKRLATFYEKWKDKIKTIIVDECFPAGTLVDGRPIETLQVGDLVRSFNHRTNTVELRPVRQLFKNRVTNLVAVTLDTGKQIVCTPGHPFWNGQEYVPAVTLQENDNVYSVLLQREKHANNQTANLCSLPNDIYSSFVECDDGADMLYKVQGNTPLRKETETNNSVHYLRDTGISCRARSIDCSKPGSRILFRNMQSNLDFSALVARHGVDKPKICFSSYAGQQSYGQPGYTNKNAKDLNSHRMEAHGAGRKRKTINGGADNTIGSTWLENRSSNTYQNGQAVGLPDMLQGRHSQYGKQDSCRSRQGFTLQSGEAKPGSKERTILSKSRVVSVKILEQTSDGTFGGMCSDGYVYNVEVEKNHNYFVDDVLVHNCHHSAANTYQQLLTMFGCLPVDRTTGKRGPDGSDVLLLGVTATPIRFDKQEVEDVFPYLVYDYSILDGMHDKHLCNVRAYRLETSISLKGMKARSGDFNEKELEERVDVDARHAVILKEVQKLVKKYKRKRVMAFCAGVDHAFHTAEYLAPVFKKTYTVTGTTNKNERPELIKQFQWGEAPSLMTNMGVFTEGTDIPQIDMIIQSRPTKFVGLYQQMIGRGLRPFDGTAINPLTGLADQNPKDFLLLLDIVDETSTPNTLMTAPRLLGLPPNFNLKGDDLLAAKDMLDDVLERDPMLAGSLNRMIESGEDLPKDFTELRSQLRRIMLFAPTNIRGRAAEYSRLSWLVADEKAMMDDDANNAKRYMLTVPQRGADKGVEPGEMRSERIYTLWYDPEVSSWKFVIQAKCEEQEAMERELEECRSCARSEGIPQYIKIQYFQKMRILKNRIKDLGLIELGTWKIRNDLPFSFQFVDSHIQNKHPSSLRLLDSAASWRKGPASEGQLKFAKDLGIPTNTTMRRGDLADLITNHQHLTRRAILE